MVIATTRGSALVPGQWTAIPTGWHKDGQMITAHTVEYNTGEEPWV